MSKIEKLRESLNKVRDDLNSKNICYNGEEDCEILDVFEKAYTKCVEKVFNESYNDVVGNLDIFDIMSCGVNDKDIIDIIVKEAKDNEVVKLDESLKEKKPLKEGTSNFGREPEYVPLLVFLTLDEFDYSMMHDSDYPQEEDFEDEDGNVDENAYWDAREKFEQEYWDKTEVCVLDEDEQERLEDALYEFNKESESMAWDADVVDDEQQYGPNLDLADIKLSVEPGYYSGAYINVENEEYLDNLEGDFRIKQMERFENFFKELKKEFGLTQLGVAWGPASNGETGYKIIKDESLLKESDEEDWEKRVEEIENKYKGKRAIFTHLDEYTDVEDLEEYEGQSCDIIGCDIADGYDYGGFDSCYWSIEFDDGYVEGGIPGGALDIDEDDFDLEDDEEEEKVYLSDKVTQVLDDYDILYGDVVENGDGSVNIVGVDEDEWDEVVSAIKDELGLDVIVPDEDHGELDNELIVRESLNEKIYADETLGKYKTKDGRLVKIKQVNSKNWGSISARPYIEFEDKKIKYQDLGLEVNDATFGALLKLIRDGSVDAYIEAHKLDEKKSKKKAKVRFVADPDKEVAFFNHAMGSDKGDVGVEASSVSLGEDGEDEENCFVAERVVRLEESLKEDRRKSHYEEIEFFPGDEGDLDAKDYIEENGLKDVAYEWDDYRKGYVLYKESLKEEKDIEKMSDDDKIKALNSRDAKKTASIINGVDVLIHNISKDEYIDPKSLKTLPGMNKLVNSKKVDESISDYWVLSDGKNPKNSKVFTTLDIDKVIAQLEANMKNPELFREGEYWELLHFVDGNDTKVWDTKNGKVKVESLKESVEGELEIEYWIDEDARDQGLGDMYFGDIADEEEGREIVRKMIDRDGFASAELLRDGEVIFGYDGVDTWGREKDESLKEGVSADDPYITDAYAFLENNGGYAYITRIRTDKGEQPIKKGFKTKEEFDKFVKDFRENVEASGGEVKYISTMFQGQQSRYTQYMK